MLDKAFLIQMAGSAVAVAVLIAIAAWARIARPTPALTEAGARALLDDEFPGRSPSQIWLSDDGQGAVARGGDLALVLARLGDRYVARELAWDTVVAARPENGVITLKLGEAGAPAVRLALAQWPPMERA